MFKTTKYGNDKTPKKYQFIWTDLLVGVEIKVKGKKKKRRLEGIRVNMGKTFLNFLNYYNYPDI